MFYLFLQLVTSGVSRQGHIAVTLQFFETVVRFEKFFAQEPQHIPEILVNMNFLDLLKLCIICLIYNLYIRQYMPYLYIICLRLNFHLCIL